MSVFADASALVKLYADEEGSALLDRAALLVAEHGLRAYDGVQLASAVATRVAAPEVNGFSAYDGALPRAASAEGFTLAAG